MKKILSYIIVVFLSSSITFIFTSYMCQQEINASQMKSSMIREGKMKTVYLSFLLQGENKLLQDYLVELLRSHLVWLDSIGDSDKYLMDMCPAWEDKMLRSSLKDASNKRLVKAFAHLQNMCK